MACLSLVSLPLACGQEGIIAGVAKLYMVAYKDMKPVVGSPFPYVLATGGIVNDISLQTSKTFVEIGTLKNTVDLRNSMVINENGTNYDSIELTMELLDITSDNQTFVNSVRGQEVAVIVQNKSGKYFAVGFNGSLKLSAMAGGLGKADADQIGYTLTFTGNDVFGMKLVESAAALEAIAAPTV
jgi:hypothetical protein